MNTLYIIEQDLHDKGNDATLRAVILNHKTIAFSSIEIVY